MGLINVADGQAGIFVWLLWGVIGLVIALLTNRFSSGRIFWVDCLAAVVLSVAGGFFTSHFIGDTPVQLFLISILGAVFGGALAVWLTSSFRRS